MAAINDYILDKFPGEYMEYLSADTVVDDEFRLSYPVEYLNSMNPGSLPPHQLKQKVGTPVMALKNLSLRNVFFIRKIILRFYLMSFKRHLTIGRGRKDGIKGETLNERVKLELRVEMCEVTVDGLDNLRGEERRMVKNLAVVG